MRKYTDEIVECPFDKSHKMPQPRLQWHLVKCQAKRDREELNLPTYHCRNNYLHVYFDKDALALHEESCNKICDDKRASRTANQEEFFRDYKGLAEDDAWQELGSKPVRRLNRTSPEAVSNSADLLAEANPPANKFNFLRAAYGDNDPTELVEILRESNHKALLACCVVLFLSLMLLGASYCFS